MARQSLEEMTEDEKNEELSKWREQRQNNLANYKFRMARNAYLLTEYRRILRSHSLEPEIQAFEKSKEDFF